MHMLLDVALLFMAVENFEWVLFDICLDKNTTEFNGIDQLERSIRTSTVMPCISATFSKRLFKLESFQISANP